jgi:hypothetical protein
MSVVVMCGSRVFINSASKETNTHLLVLLVATGTECHGLL